MEYSEQGKKSNSFWILIIFFINPFLSLVVSGRDYLSKYFTNIIWLFCTFYGYTFYPVRNTMDSFRHREDFLRWATEREMTFDYFLNRLYGDDVSFVDILLPLLKFLVSRVTDDPNIFYGVLGCLFGYFYSRNIRFILSYYNLKINKYSAIFLFMFAITIPMWEINSFRFWLAAHIFVLAGFKILFHKKNIAYLAIFITPFIHFSFVFVIILFFIYKLIGNKITIHFIILMSSIFLGQFNITKSVQSVLPTTSIESLDDKTTGYTSEGYIEDRAESSQSLNWYAKYRSLPVKYLTFLILAIIFFKHKDEITQSDLLPLFCAGLFIFSISFTIMSSVPVFGRYNRIGQMFIYAFLFLFFLKKKNTQWYRKIHPYYIAAASLFIIVSIRGWFDTMTIDTLISNPLMLMFYHSNENIINFIK
ncbi:hypothetical protein E0W68_00625 [Flavobacterium salilacus subsp. salilacus]|uniref:EpsG family protein n=1 Tax=Flavobacterium TaxID=237 RepID=UPI0010750A93|nr:MULTISPECIES: EpsG family protein [Flavobacterium]KAF2519769.1 hypothetical protein E0W68_00625 [Flavobacterium salilacus subsp. salilacus]MBE1614335.1 EpsG family protein [Flavobacterium sp. SaA2.13]